MCAMRGAERIIHIDVTVAREFLRERGIVRFLFRVKTEIFQHQYFPRAEVIHHLPDLGADAIFGELHRAIKEPRQVVRHRLQRKLGVRTAFRAAKMAHENQRSPLGEDPVYRRERFDDSLIIGNFQVGGHGDIEVHAHEDSLPLQQDIINGQSLHGHIRIKW